MRPAMRTRGCIRQFFRGLRSVVSQNLRDGVTGVEPLAISAEAQSLDFRRAAEALSEQIVFQGQERNSLNGV